MQKNLFYLNFSQAKGRIGTLSPQPLTICTAILWGFLCPVYIVAPKCAHGAQGEDTLVGSRG